MTNGLQSKLARMQDAEMEVKQLRETLAEYNEEFRQVRNQGRNKITWFISFYVIVVDRVRVLFYCCVFAITRT